MMVRKSENRTDRFVFPVPLITGEQAVVDPEGSVWVLPSSAASLLRLRASSRQQTVLQPQPHPADYTARERDSLFRHADSIGFGESLRAALPPSKGATAPNQFLLAPSGHFWTGLYAPDGSTTTEVISPNGCRLGVVPMPPHSRLVGVGRSRYFVTVADEDGLETLQALPLPRFAAK